MVGFGLGVVFFEGDDGFLVWFFLFGGFVAVLFDHFLWSVTFTSIIMRNRVLVRRAMRFISGNRAILLITPRIGTFYRRFSLSFRRQNSTSFNLNYLPKEILKLCLLLKKGIQYIIIYFIFLDHLGNIFPYIAYLR